MVISLQDKAIFEIITLNFDGFQVETIELLLLLRRDNLLEGTPFEAAARGTRAVDVDSSISSWVLIVGDNFWAQRFQKKRKQSVVVGKIIRPTQTK